VNRLFDDRFTRVDRWCSRHLRLVLVLDGRLVIDLGDVGCRNIDIDVVGCDRRFPDDVGGTSAASDARRFRGHGSRRCGRCRRSRWRPAPAARRRRGLLLGADAFLTLPARANTRDLVIGEKSEMAAHGDVHLTKEGDHLVAGNPELACHVVYTKLAQTVLLAGSTRVRGMPLGGGRLDDGTNALRELWIDDSDGGRRLPSYRGAKF